MSVKNRNRFRSKEFCSSKSETKRFFQFQGLKIFSSLISSDPEKNLLTLSAKFKFLNFFHFIHVFPEVQPN